MNLEKELKGLKKDISLSEHNTLKVGGRARMFIEVDNKEDLKNAIYLANYNHIPYYILGEGTNILISDRGFDGIIIKNKIKHSEFDGEKEYLIAGSGASMGSLVLGAKKHGLSGLEWASGLPGTLGGAIFGNAGCCGSSISEHIDFVDVLDPVSLTFKHLLNDDCQFKYRESVFKKNGYIILGAMLKLKKDDPVNIMNKMAENMVFRKDHQPLSMNSEGCVFKNIDLSLRDDAPVNLWKDIPEFSVFVKKGMVPAGFLIDRAGLKGLKIGGASVSERHANFIVSDKDAKASDIYLLIKEIKKRVKEKFSIELEEEVRLLGFE